MKNEQFTIALNAAATNTQVVLEHRQGADCWCIPVVQQYEHADVVIHNDPKARGGES